MAFSVALFLGVTVAPFALQSASATGFGVPQANEANDGADHELPVAVIEGAQERLPVRVRDVSASSRALTRLSAELAYLEETITANRIVRDDATQALVGLRNQRDRQRGELAQANSDQLEASFRMERHRGELLSLAVSAYVGGSYSPESLVHGASQANVAGSEAVILSQVEAALLRNLGLAQNDFAAATKQIQTAELSLQTTLDEINTAQAELARSLNELERVEPLVPQVQEQYHDAFMLATVDGADFSVVALDAYLGAVELLPNCRIDWTMLAGIGRVESFHGTFGRSQPRPNGVVAPRIIGIALDGSEGVALINDTDGGRLDGDALYDRAIGPMQFVPTTWRSWSRDGNGDGIHDPHNLYDAAAATAAYLCKSSSRLDNQSNLRRALLTYNHSNAYVNTVFGHHIAYRRLNIG